MNNIKLKQLIKQILIQQAILCNITEQDILLKYTADSIIKQLELISNDCNKLFTKLKDMEIIQSFNIDKINISNTLYTIDIYLLIQYNIPEIQFDVNQLLECLK